MIPQNCQFYSVLFYSAQVKKIDEKRIQMFLCLTGPVFGKIPDELFSPDVEMTETLFKE